MMRKLAACAALYAGLASAATAQTVAPQPFEGMAPSTAQGSAIDQQVDKLIVGPQDAMVAIDAGGDALLFGSYLHPETRKFPAVLILPAAGADRNGVEAGKDPKADIYRQLARALAARNIASLRIDKRGVGGSGKALAKEDDLRFETYVDDAAAWIKFLEAQPRVGCVVVLGHAESGLVAALAAKKVKVCAIIEMSGASRPAAALLADQLKSAVDGGRLDKDAYAEAAKILASLAAGKAVPDPPAKLNALFRPSVQPYLMSWLNIDPLEALKTSTPVLILQGAGDRTLGPEDARRLATAPKAVRVVIVPGADHDLRLPPGPVGKSGLQAPAALSPQVAQAISDFIDRVK